MAIETVDQLLARLPAAQNLLFSKASAVAKGAGLFHSLFRVSGVPGVGDSPLIAGEVPTKGSPGALNFANPSGGLKSYLGGCAIVPAESGMLMLGDRLWHNGGVDCNITTEQAITGAPITRHAAGGGVEIWGEVISAFGATETTFSVEYTNTAGTAGRIATYTFDHGAPVVGQAFKFNLQDEDVGALSIQNITCSAATGAAGNLGLVLFKRHASIPFTAGEPIELDAMRLKMAEVAVDACLSAMFCPSGVNTGVFTADIALVQG